MATLYVAVECPSNTYGDGCMPCSGNCQDNAVCDSVTGHCAGCIQWYTGDRCHIEIGRTCAWVTDSRFVINASITFLYANTFSILIVVPELFHTSIIIKVCAFAIFRSVIM